jgi:hypothetical protein
MPHLHLHLHSIINTAYSKLDTPLGKLLVLMLQLEGPVIELR